MKIARLSLYSMFFLALFFIDRITKYLVINYIPWYEINSFFSLYYVQNTGVSWGIGDGYGQNWHNVIMGSVILLIVAIMEQTIRKYILYENVVPELLVCAGAISNLYDRVFYGGVIDFLCFQFGLWQFPIFNGADIMIVCGIGLIIYKEMFFNE